ncbi:alternate signal-mediated exported protein [Prescottella equi]|uniref:Alternate signal-mediated exported protein, RER_14450 family n=1 Tax=Prescottella equi ATCC 33707 TaxID=525370 RepID=E9T1D8_RHOHA|nr:alternate-type signal peptide domain-containing protein [Prescottella equi]EGD23846.1 hypothetical protein HMPREF0724_12054 [Prescottella equi ATCC 33707]MBU4617553.1 alternate-type signal peptide domain-containing protein [Rhodococcus sp. GG48]NKS30475.1 alternate-type signal peptide domain-containing protein [Prescottella equi]ORL83237.1 hypothetical protein A5905_06030 [Prescottella equi]
MNKKTKGAIAAGAAAALLAGGAGTFATWSDSKTLDAGTVTAGKLQFTGTPAGEWYKGTDTSATGTKITDIATYRVVPGDVLTYKATADFIAQGDNLNATLSLDETAAGSFSGLTWGATSVSATGVDGSGVITPNDGTVRSAVVTKTATFAASTSGTTSQGATAALNGLQLKLTQTS